MSRFRATPLRNQFDGNRRSGLAGFGIIAILVIVLGIVGAVIYWKFFYNRNFTAAELLPKNTELLMNFDWRKDSAQGKNLNDISKDLGGVTTLEGLLERMIGTRFANTDIKFREDITPWLGDELAVARLHLSARDEEVNLLSIGDEAGKTAFLEKITKESDTESTESVNGRTVHSLFGTTPVAYAEVGNFVVIADKPQVVKTILQSVGGKNNLSKAEDFKLVQRNINQDSLVRAFMDISPFFRAPAQFGISPEIAINLEGQARLGITLQAQPGGFATQIFVPEKQANSETLNKFTHDILGIIPNDISGYFGANNLAGFADDYINKILDFPTLKEKGITKESVEKDYGINFDEDLYSWMKNEYAVVYLNQDSDDFAVIFKVDDRAATEAKLKKVEKALSGIVAAFSKDDNKGSFVFQDGPKLRDKPIRTIPLAGSSGYSLSYSFYDNYLVFGTSQAALEKILIPDSKQPVLNKSKIYDLITSSLPTGNTSGEAYLNGKILIDFLDSLGYDFSPISRHFVGIGFRGVNIEEGKLLTGFLPII